MSKNIFSVHLHSVPGKGMEELEKIFKYSHEFKSTNHQKYLAWSYISSLIKEIEDKNGFFYKKDLKKILLSVERQKILSKKQCDDIMLISGGGTPEHEIEPEEKAEPEESKKTEKSEVPEKPVDDYDLAAAANNDDLLSAERQEREANLEKLRRDEELREMAKDT